MTIDINAYNALEKLQHRLDSGDVSKYDRKYDKS